MGVALENANLFEETQRLLKETEQRNAELAVINSIQQGLAAELNFQAIIDLVGDKIRDIFDAQSVGIGSADVTTGLMTVHYLYENGQYYHPEPSPMGKLAKHLLDTRAPILLRTPDDFSKFHSELIPGTELPKSGVFVPLSIEGELKGTITLQNIDREDAFSESDINLLNTLASSMSVALENARLFEETEQRNSELAVINSIQQGLAAELNFQAIIDLVGDKLREVLETDDLIIRWYDPAANLLHFLYCYEHGKRIEVPPAPPLTKAWFKVVETHQPLILNTLAELNEMSGLVIPGTDVSLSMVTVPIVASDRVMGSISIENFEREYAFTESNIRLLQTVASSMG